MELDRSVVGEPLEAPDLHCDSQRTILYALGVGAGPEALGYTWEGVSDLNMLPSLKVLPSFAVVPTMPLVFNGLDRIRADYRTLVHGEQSLVQHRPIQPGATLRTTGRVSAIYDKGKGALVVIDTETTDDDGPVFDTTWSIFCRGQGGFGGDRGPAPTRVEARPGAEPVLDRDMPTSPAQALLYRLSGDRNPLHVDPELARTVGFKGPILHGLCTYGFATRALVADLCAGDPARFRSFKARFSKEVYPGDVLRVRAVPAVSAGVFLVEVHVDDRQVLSQGVAELHVR